MGKDYVGRFTKKRDEVTSKENLMKLRIKKIIGWVVFGLLVGGTIAQELCATPTRARDLCKYSEDYKYSSARFYEKNEKDWDFLIHYEG